MDSNLMASNSAQRLNLSNSYAAKRSSNTFGRSRARKDYSNQLKDSTKSYKRGAPQVTSNYASRGLGQSGVYQRALQRYTGDYSEQQGQIQRNAEDSEQQYTFDDAAYETEYYTALGRLDIEKAQMIADTASGIQGLRAGMS
tara:strand:+ start:18 stop:443 length:426 start_codon:yes stop_codon:yes gene_type:complete